MKEFSEINLSISKLFDIVSKEENIEYQIDKEYFQSMDLFIQNESNDWKNINGLIKKEANVLRVIFKNGNYIDVADTHLFLDSDKKLIEANALKNNDRLFHETDEYVVNQIIGLGEKVVYDIEINSSEHLFKTADGLTHHNTLLTAALVHYANELNMNTITIVPSSSLLKQTFDYLDGFDIDVGMFGAGKNDEAKNIVATWQTLQNNKPYMKNFEFVIWDEVHNAKSFQAQQIMQQATNSFIRLGLTGTVPKDPLDRANLTAAFGPVIKTVKAKELQDRNILSKISINIFKLKYPKEYKSSFIDWHDETTFLQTNDMFKKFMTAMVSTLKGNTLILMKNIDPAEELSEKLDCTYISSKLNVNKRKDEFKKFVYNGNHIAVGTYSLLSTGIDIVHINNLILAPTPGKSFTKIIQSIGRGLRRKSGEKEHVTVFDLTSNLKYDTRHIKSRKEFYEEADYPFQEDIIDLKDFM